MKKLPQFFLTGILAITMLAACQEGPSEKKGKQIDNSMEKIQDKVLNKGPAQKTGEKIDELTH